MNGAALSKEMLRLYMQSPYPAHLRRDSSKGFVVIHEFIGQVFYNYLLSALMLFTGVLALLIAVLPLVRPDIESGLGLVTAVLSAVAGMLTVYLTYRQKRLETKRKKRDDDADNS